MVWLQLAELPQASVAFHVLVILYVPGQLPGMNTSTKVNTGFGSQASVTVGGVNTAWYGHSLITNITKGQLITGGVISRTTMVWLQLAEFPQASLAVHVLVILYVPGQRPGVVTSTNVTAGFGSQASVTTGGGNTGWAGQLIGDTTGAQVIVGGVIS